MRAWAVACAAIAALTACPAPPRPVLRTPSPHAGAGAGREERPAAAGVVHLVGQGDTLYRIAKAYGMEPSELMAANGITDPHALPVGTELRVPGARRAVDVPPAPGAETAARATSTRPVAGRDELPARGPSPQGAATTSGARPPALAWPLRGVLYGRFGVRGGARHDGIDIAAPEGTPVLAAAHGKAIYVGEQPGYGMVVILRHGDGLVTVYAHNSAVLVREGARVERGQAVARVGQTGRTSGPHLHFEVREGTRPRNPLLYLQ